MAQNAQEKIIDEIERLVVLRSRYEELRPMRNVIVEPQIALMTATIDQAKKAAASGDAVLVLQALRECENWTD